MECSTNLEFETQARICDSANDSSLPSSGTHARSLVVCPMIHSHLSLRRTDPHVGSSRSAGATVRKRFGISLCWQHICEQRITFGVRHNSRAKHDDVALQAMEIKIFSAQLKSFIVQLSRAFSRTRQRIVRQLCLWHRCLERVPNLSRHHFSLGV